MRIRPKKSIAKKTALIVAVFVTTVCSSVRQSVAATFAISEPQLSIDVRDDFRIVGEFNGIVQRGKLQGGRLWVSLTIIGGKNALDALERSQELVLKVESWSAYKRLRVYSTIGLTREKWQHDRKGLWSEYNEKRVFTWRTNFYTDQTSYSKIYFKFWGPNDEEISPFGVDGAYQAEVDIVP